MIKKLQSFIDKLTNCNLDVKVVAIKIGLQRGVNSQYKHKQLNSHVFQYFAKLVDAFSQTSKRVLVRCII